MALNLPKPDMFRRSRELIFCGFCQLRENWDRLADLLHREQPCRERIVNVRGVIRNLVGQVDQLCFESRALPGKEVLKLGFSIRAEFPGVLYNAFPNLER